MFFFYSDEGDTECFIGFLEVLSRAITTRFLVRCYYTNYNSLFWLLRYLAIACRNFTCRETSATVEYIPSGSRIYRILQRIVYGKICCIHVVNTAAKYLCLAGIMSQVSQSVGPRSNVSCVEAREIGISNQWSLSCYSKVTRPSCYVRPHVQCFTFDVSLILNSLF